MNATQCKMALAGLGWTLDDLTAASGLSRRTVARFTAHGVGSPETIETLRQALAKAGAAFENGGKRYGVSVLRRDGE